ncbi:IclR family transcriptional regulator [Hydrogenophaga palleronii]|uniref:IclR family transcriptional regulator n=1 Tax=Hydrogenophaga palleronii TaxID=65655 RepID=UPI000826C930|nr:helix-turn-helix domain-containing protein [Hydrogenophaga palleronii]
MQARGGQREHGEAPEATQTLERALKLLVAFRADSKPLSNAELALRTGFSKASVSRITHSLVAMGYLDRSADQLRFQIGRKSHLLGQAFLCASPLEQAARPIMQAFADAHDVSVALAIPNQLDMLYLQCCNSCRSATLRHGIGSMVPIGLTSIGRAWLSAQDLDTRERYTRNLLSRAADAKALDMALARAFQEFQSGHYCTALGEYQRDAFGVATVVEIGAASTVMGLSFGAVSVAPDLTHIRQVLARALIEAAAALKQACQGLGGAAKHEPGET